MHENRAQFQLACIFIDACERISTYQESLIVRHGVTQDDIAILIIKYAELLMRAYSKVLTKKPRKIYALRSASP